MLLGHITQKKLNKQGYYICFQLLHGGAFQAPFNINAGQHEQSLINSINIILNIFKYTFKTLKGHP